MDTHQVDADPDSDFYLIRIPESRFLFDADADLDPEPTFNAAADTDPDPCFQIKAQTLEKVLK